MSNIWIAVGVFACLVFASMSMMLLYPKLSTRHRDDETNTVVRLVANIFVVMTSLVFGLLINSAKNTFEAVDANVHAYGTSLIILDRTLRSYASDAEDARKHLETYVEEAIVRPERGDDALRGMRNRAARYLDDLGDALEAITPTHIDQRAILLDARQQYHSIVQQRWKLVEQSEGRIPPPVIAMLIAWFTLIFGSFGYRAPINPMVTGMFAVSALLIAASVYLVLDMNVPFHGPIQVSDAPLRRALAEIRLH